MDNASDLQKSQTQHLKHVIMYVDERTRPNAIGGVPSYCGHNKRTFGAFFFLPIVRPCA